MDDKKVVIVIIVILVCFSILSLITLKVFESIKYNIPKFNYDSLEIEELNSEIEELFKESFTDENMKISYKKYENNMYSSLVIKTNVYDEKTKNTVTFYSTYVVDKINYKVLTDEEVMHLFNYSEEQIESLIVDRLREYYNDEVSRGIIDKNTCDFECYKFDYREITEIDYIYALSIEKERLVIYFNLNSTPVIEDEYYFKKIKNPNRIVI